MKIGIISINAHTKVLNFASPLHSYAFWAYLKNHGIESTIIDYKPVYYGKFDPRHPLLYYRERPNPNDPDWQEQIKKWTALFDEREYRLTVLKHSFKNIIRKPGHAIPPK